MQDGCNQFCTYCIIPYARGRVRSRKPGGRVAAEVHALAENGYREVVLTGIHLSSYGIDFDGERHLLDLIRTVHGVEGIMRIRLGSLEPGIITEEFAEELASLPKMCPHFHLSLQSGCDATLKRMNRRYTSAEYYEKCCILGKYFDNPALTTDVIVGFPGRDRGGVPAVAWSSWTEWISMRRISSSTHAVQATKAADMDGQVSEQVKTRRSARMICYGEKRDGELTRRGFIGKEVEVLVEEPAEIDGGKSCRSDIQKNILKLH